MKKLITAIVILAVAGLQSLKAQSTTAANGIYLTENDYKTGKPAYTLGNHDSMRLNEFLAGKNIDVVYQGKKMKFSKSGIFGYRLNNQDFRFYSNDAYRIIDTAGFVLYEREKLTQHGKGLMPVEHYFYSVNSNHPVLDLTIANLWNSFPGSPDFRYSLQNYFHKDEELRSFDQATNQYEIKHLYFEHKNTIASQRAM